MIANYIIKTVLRTYYTAFNIIISLSKIFFDERDTYRASSR